MKIASKLAELDSNSDQPDIVSVRFMLEVEDLLNSEFMTIMPVAFTKELVRNAMNFDDLADVVMTPIKDETAPPMKKKRRFNSSEMKNGPKEMKKKTNILLRMLQGRRRLVLSRCGYSPLMKRL